MKAISIFSLATAFVILASCQSQDEKKIIQQAQSDARQTIATAELRAKQIIENAENEAERIINEAKDKVERIMEEVEDEVDRIIEEAEDEAMRIRQEYPNSYYSNNKSSSSIFISLSDLYKIVDEYATNAAAADIKYKGTRIITEFNYFDINTAYGDTFEIVKSSGLLLDYTFITKASQKEIVASLNKSSMIRIEGTLTRGSKYGLSFNESVILGVKENSPN